MFTNRWRPWYNLGHLSCDLDKQFICQCDIKQNVILPLTTITSDLKVVKHIVILPLTTITSDLKVVKHIVILPLTTITSDLKVVKHIVILPLTTITSDLKVVKHIVILPLTTITSDLKVSTYIITSISPRPTGLLAILVKICVLKEILYYYFKVQDMSFIL